MPYVPVVVELDYVNTGNFGVPANDQLTTIYTAPDGWHLMSWGVINASSDVVRIVQAQINLVDDVPTFTGVLHNDDSTDHTARWFFVLLKK